MRPYAPVCAHMRPKCSPCGPDLKLPASATLAPILSKQPCCAGKRPSRAGLVRLIFLQLSMSLHVRRRRCAHMRELELGGAPKVIKQTDGRCKAIGQGLANLGAGHRCPKKPACICLGLGVWISR